MADNLTAPATGAKLATDEIDGVHHPLSKLEFGADGTATPVSEGNPLPVAGPVTNAELRATPLPVSIAELEIKNDSGNPLPVSGPATDAQLRATPLPVSIAELEIKNDSGNPLPVSGPATDAQLRATPLPVSIAELEIKNDSGNPLPVSVIGTEYETVAANAADQALGAAGAAGDLLVGVLIIPGSTSPGAVSIKDGAGAAITVFTGGATSVSNLVPFMVPLGIKSTGGAWKVSTGANVSAIGIGDFS